MLILSAQDPLLWLFLRSPTRNRRVAIVFDPSTPFVEQFQAFRVLQPTIVPAFASPHEQGRQQLLDRTGVDVAVVSRRPVLLRDATHLASLLQDDREDGSTAWIPSNKIWFIFAPALAGLAIFIVGNASKIF